MTVSTDKLSFFPCLDDFWALKGKFDVWHDFDGSQVFDDDDQEYNIGLIDHFKVSWNDLMEYMPVGKEIPSIKRFWLPNECLKEHWTTLEVKFHESMDFD